MGMQEPVEMVKVLWATRCSCSEVLHPGERAGRIGDTEEILCLWCLADLRAGRPRARSRRVDTPRPVVAQRLPRRSAHRRASPRRHRGSTGVTVVIALLAVGAALVIRPAILGSQPGAVVAGVAIPGSDVATWGNLSPLIAGASQDARRLWPPVPSDAQTHPLASPPPSASSSTEFVFLKTVSGAGSRPVTWDPCRPIHLVVNSAQAPAGGDQLIREAAGAVSSATGLRLVVDGPTTEVPSGQRPPEDTARYGNQWSPVLVAWTDPSVVADLAGPVAGVAGPVEAPYFTQAQQHWVSGVVNLDGPDFRTILQRQDGWAQARATVMHEFGHLVGLAHTPGRAELMNAQNVGQLSFGAGDREGLRQLGLGPCFTS